MATDFNTNSVSVAGGLKPSTTDTPIDIRARVETEADILTIPKPYIGMIVYVKDTGKRFEVLSLKDGRQGMTVIKNGLVNEYREMLVSYNDLLDKPEIPSIEGLASEEMVNNGLEAKVSKEEGKSLVDDVEIERLSQVHNYDDSELRSVVDNKANKDELFSGNYEDLNNLPEIPSIEGLASEEYVQEKINAIPEVDLEPYAKREELFNKDYNELNNLPEIPSIEGLASEEMVNNGLEAKVDKVEGKSLVDDVEVERLAGIFNANYQFQVNMIEYGVEPSVEMQGEYPNITVVFNIPYALPPEEELVGRMWYGWIPYDETGQVGVMEPDEINENMTYKSIQFGLDKGSLIEADPAPIGKVTLFVEANAFICVIVPKNSNIVAYADNGLGQAVPFNQMDQVSGLAQDNCNIINPINGVEYTLYGLYDTNGGGTYYIHIEEK